MGWIAVSIFFAGLFIANGLCQAAINLSNTKISIVLPKTYFTIETSRDGEEKTGHIHTRIH